MFRRSDSPQSTDVKLRFYLLGPPRVEWAGCPVVIPRRQARALLYRLAAQLQPVAREHLCFLFWPDVPEGIAHRHLSHLLTHLRSLFPAPNLLLSDGDQVSLDAQHVWSDTAEFEQLCVAPHQPVEWLEQAVTLYRGSFLAGFSLPNSPEFEAWMVQAGNGLERLYLKSLSTLMEERIGRAAYEQAIVFARRYLETDSLAEEVHRSLIALYATVGDRPAALRQFESCVTVLERELGVSPLPETRAIYQAVLEGQRPPVLTAARRETKLVEPTWATLPSLDLPLTGRDEALQRLTEAFCRARSGQGGVTLITGEPGIGKSRLMQEFARHLPAPALVLVGAGHPSTQTMPYQPIVEALRPALGNKERGIFSSSPSLLRSLSPFWLAEASRLLPELRACYPDLPLPLPTEPAEARGRLFEALSQLILALATGPQPLLLCLDDLHWADATTLDWLAYLGRHLPAHRLLVIGAYRVEEAGVLSELRHSLTRSGVLSELALTGLDATAVRRLLHHLTLSLTPLHPSSPLPPEKGEGGEVSLASRLQQATGGNPFFLLETLRTLLEADRLAKSDRSPGALFTGAALASGQDDLPLPDTIRQAITARLQHLSTGTRQVLEAGAILGPSFSFEQVRLTAGRSEMATMDSLDEMVARQLLVEEAGGYRFHHDLTQRVVEAGLSPVRRQLLHRRAGRALERLFSPLSMGEGPGVATLAYHFAAGGEDQKALYYHGLAAERATALFAWHEAEEHLGRMLTLLDRLEPDCRQPEYRIRRGQLLIDRAHCRFLQGRLAERDADLTALSALAEASNHLELRLQALVQCSRYLNLDARYEEAIAVAQEGLALVSPLGDHPVQCHLLSQIGFAHYFLGQPQPAIEALESALAGATSATDPRTRGEISRVLGYLHYHLGNYARSLTYYQESYACYQALGDYSQMAWGSLCIGGLYQEMGEMTEARRYLDECLALARRIGARPIEAQALHLIGVWQLYRGEYIAAADHFQQTLALERELRSAHVSAAAEEGMGFALYYLGDLIQARHWLTRAVDRARAIGHRRRLSGALVGLGLVAVASGQLETAYQILTEAVAVARSCESRETLVAGLAALARAERQQDDFANALVHAGEAVRIAQEIPLPAGEMWGEMETGLILLAQGDAVTALEHTARAVALMPQGYEPWISNEEVHQAHGRVLRALGRIEAAEEQARLAAAIIAAKAGQIPDPEQRQRYLQFANR